MPADRGSAAGVLGSSGRAASAHKFSLSVLRDGGCVVVMRVAKRRLCGAVPWPRGPGER
jgi:hypothetical protein